MKLRLEARLIPEQDYHHVRGIHLDHRTKLLEAKERLNREKK